MVEINNKLDYFPSFIRALVEKVIQALFKVGDVFGVYKLGLGIVTELEVLGVVSEKTLESCFPEFRRLVELDVFYVGLGKI
jgi:hypothetical protein